MTGKSNSSSGHKLGQLVGDWFEEYVATYLLGSVASKLNLYIDHRFKERSCRGSKIIWKDIDGNDVDYDFVLELNGSDTEKGIPLAFFETFWRRGSRHSKDKARDDSGKLMPMRATYPTARILGIISAGDFTRPAQELVSSRGIDLFYIPKSHICKAWEDAGVIIDYDDKAPENVKSDIVNNAISILDDKLKKTIFENIRSDISPSVFRSYINKIIAGVSSVPIEYKITDIFIGNEITFNQHDEVIEYISSDTQVVSFDSSNRLFRYQAIFSDGNIFERVDLTRDEALQLHESVGVVAKHFTN
ncbi:hypothetical protein [Photobacterium sp. GB-56]|uniref:hypothetical protein n=1 Tax=Photobacterium sp. GB-56 TaxID=2022106 RepID=UPI000D180034|nr:hypothetical protein [Photobacterium sp. GB-56]PSV23148.1 hypothetical protein C9J42_20110 [Photobacterium sp. GB-56]